MKVHLSHKWHMVEITSLMAEDDTAPVRPPTGMPVDTGAAQANPAPPSNPEQVRRLQVQKQELDNIRHQLVVEGEVINHELELQVIGGQARTRA